MKKYGLIVIALLLVITACKEENKEKKQEAENLVSIKNGVFTQYYPGKKHIKFQGAQDEKGNRNGKWSFYNENGLELSTTMYDRGKKHGHSIVKHPNGAVFYIGEYFQDKKVGVWTIYDQSGKIMEEKDFGSVQ